MAPLTGFTAIETPAFLKERLDKFGGVEAYNHYAVGWAHAMDTPYQWTKQVASHSEARAMGPSCIGRRASRPRVKSAPSFIM